MSTRTKTKAAVAAGLSALFMVGGPLTASAAADDTRPSLPPPNEMVALVPFQDVPEAPGSVSMIAPVKGTAECPRFSALGPIPLSVNIEQEVTGGGTSASPHAVRLTLSDYPGHDSGKRVRVGIHFSCKG